MTATVVRTELALLWRDRTAAVALAAFGLLSAYALAHGAREGERRVEASRDLLAAAEEQWERARAEAREIEEAMAAEGRPLSDLDWGPRHPYHAGTSLGARVAMPPAPLAALAVGQADLQASDYKVTAGSSVALAPTDQLENPSRLLAGHLDLAFVVLHLFPLLILALSYNQVSAEREAGSLALLLSHPISLRRLVAAKVLARALLLGGAAVAAALVGFFAGGGLDRDGAFERLGLWLLATLLYGAFWVALAVAVGALARPSATNAVILAACWLALVVVVPSLVNAAAARLYPVPPRIEFITATRSASAEATRERSVTLARYFEDHPEIAPVADDAANFAMLRVAADERVARALAPVVERFESQRARQQALVRRLAFLSPTLLAHQALLDAAGTGADRHRRFLRRVRDFQYDWNRFFEARYFAARPFGPAEYGEVPRFVHAEEPPADVAGRAFAPAAALATASLALVAWAARRYRRFPVVG